MFFYVYFCTCKFLEGSGRTLLKGIKKMKITAEDKEKLSHIFDKTTATYKFYWMLSLLDIVQQGRSGSTISFDEMVARMMSKAWHPAKIGMFDFGKCDSLRKRIDALIGTSPLCVLSMEDRVRCFIMSNRNSAIVRQLIKEMTKYVPYRFLYPWIGTCSNADAESRSIDPGRRSLYFISDNKLTINPLWRNYIIENADYLHGWAFEKLCIFLHNRNPGFILPAGSDIKFTADGTSLRKYSIPDREYPAVAAERLHNTTFLYTEHLVIEGGMLNKNSRINIKNNFEDNRKKD